MGIFYSILQFYNWTFTYIQLLILVSTWVTVFLPFRAHWSCTNHLTHWSFKNVFGSLMWFEGILNTDTPKSGVETKIFLLLWFDDRFQIANSLSNTVKDLRMEASTKKFSSMSIRPRTLAILSHQSHCKSTRENSRLRNAARFTTFVNSWKHWRHKKTFYQWVNTPPGC